MVTAPMLQRVRRLMPEPASPVQAALVVAATASLVTFLIVHNTGRPDAIERTPPVQATIDAQPFPVSQTGLTALASSIDQPIFWVGPRSGVTYELTRADTNVYIRYLPAGVRVGERTPVLTIHTYPLKNAFAATQAIGNEPKAVFHKLAGGGLAAYRPSRPTTIYVAYPDGDYQVEVFAPNPEQAQRLATSAQLQPVPRSP